ncbi:MAG: hypothetical protein C4536_01575 [Actinobacteria bacterium]|nr:MAG: hypothetical protein C4536_01575 [Actinomycetota bacterium]
MSVRKRFMLGLGHTYNLLYRAPVIGESLVRGICRILGFLNYHSPYGPRPRESMAELRDDFAKMVALMDFDIESVHEDEEKLEIILTACPYGFCRPEHAGVCDAAMDMDRAMFGHAGYGLIVDTCIPRGALACRICIRKQAEAAGHTCMPS